MNLRTKSEPYPITGMHLRSHIDSNLKKKIKSKRYILHPLRTTTSVNTAWAIWRKTTALSVLLKLYLNNKNSITWLNFKWEILLFLGLWEGQANENITLFKNWPVSKDFIPRKYNIEIAALVNPENVLLPPLHMKLWFTKNSVKALGKSRRFPLLGG